MDNFVRTRKKNGKPVIYIHPITGDYKVPMEPDAAMPLRYKMQGYERREFNSYFEHNAWCRSKGLVNHYAEGVRNDDDVAHSGNKDSLGK